ncbi:MarR family transcriptional regulator [Sphingomonas naphthae]|uniref:MarR family transcriptional regulator n=1 Tax=Sphingomonas naphthae TaxID=1813468 RepID=A0ABY7TFL2_9SPHN|nr:MarR family transcriptional regulator [Sphingomonas naphthae]WCT72032.1 MarR family transcriptional regulator [Sphingomonas naphthae]
MSHAEANFEMPVLAARARHMLVMRRRRGEALGAQYFADPCWDMMLDLFAAQIEGKSISTTSLCVAANVPTTTALRWIQALLVGGHITQRTDDRDARVKWVALSPATFDKIARIVRESAAPV